jgi:integrase
LSNTCIILVVEQVINLQILILPYANHTHVISVLKRFLKGTDFEYLTLHKLRHTNATLFLNNGIHLKIVSEHLGHADIQITAGTYTAVLDSSRIKNAELME